ncbi:MAG: squalene/phytoene synthase family protein [bacterium]|nr:squalene/phytoene synthase family protein [bacterium]
MTFDNKQSLDFAREIDFSKILTNPILDIAARFWDSERYAAFRVCYRSMRRIDDLVDDRKEQGEPITPEESTQMQQLMQDWLDAARAKAPGDDFQAEFLRTTNHFRIPLWPWERLCKAMIYDLSHNGYRNFRGFLRYAEGAAISPASVFMHLCGVTPKDGTFEPPSYDIRKGARDLALFSYLVHIVRDFQKDHLRGLNYFADDLLAEQSLHLPELADIAHTGRPTQAFRLLIRRYMQLAEYYRQRARATVDRLLPLLEPRYQLSLEIIYGLYLLTYQQIEPNRGRFSSKDTNASPERLQLRIEQIVSSFIPHPRQ